MSTVARDRVWSLYAGRIESSLEASLVAYTTEEASEGISCGGCVGIYVSLPGEIVRIQVKQVVRVRMNDRLSE